MSICGWWRGGVLELVWILKNSFVYRKLNVEMSGKEAEVLLKGSVNADEE